jgi:thiamine-phosphate pyrophosphorylase
MSAAIIEARAARRARLRGLYAITPEIDDTSSLVDAVESAIAGGASAVQYRRKSGTAYLLREQAAALAACCRTRGALFIVNDRPELAAEVDADGVHVGRDDAGIATARTLVGDAALIGVSCYDDVGRARELVDAGADCVAFGSMFASQVKPQAVRAPLSLLSAARSLGVPIVAIGGIDASNAAAAIDAGADAVAVISAVFAARDIEAAARSIASACASAARARRATHA